MAFIAIKCTQCGSSIEIDNAKESGTCPYCGSSFITEKVINNYNTYINNKIVITGDNQEQLLDNMNIMSLNAAAEKCERLYAIKDFDALEKLSGTMIEKWPLSYLGYMNFIKSYQIFAKLNTPEFASYVKTEAEFYISRCNQNYQHDIQNLYSNMIERMSVIEREENKEFISSVKKIIIAYINELKATLNKKRKLWTPLFISSILILIALLISSSVTNVFNSTVGLVLMIIAFAIEFFYICICSTGFVNTWRYSKLYRKPMEKDLKNLSLS